MHRDALHLATLLSLLVLALAGCNDESTAPIVAAERPQPANNPATDTAEAPSTGNSGDAASAPEVPSPATPAVRGPTKDVTFDTVKLALEKDQPFERDLLTPDVLAIDNQPIRIRGYILPSFQQTGIKQFVLVRDNQECCFGPGAALHDCIVVDMKPGVTTEYTVRPVAVEGIFSIREMMGIDGKHLAIYHLEGEAVE